MCHWSFITGDLVVHIDWPKDREGIFYTTGFGTDLGVCELITPIVSANSSKLLAGLPKGCFSGSNNGLQLLLDAEVFDYGAYTT